MGTRLGWEEDRGTVWCTAVQMSREEVGHPTVQMSRGKVGYVTVQVSRMKRLSRWFRSSVVTRS
jgi:hypothetical protein